MQLIVVMMLVAQVVFGSQGYTVADADRIDLAMDNGLYAIELGPGCEDITAGMNVEWLAGSGDVGSIVPLGTNSRCNVYISDKLSDQPCAMNDDGVCDVNLVGVKE